MHKTLWGNTIQSYLVFFAIFLGGIVLTLIIQKIIMRRLKVLAKRTENQLDDFFVKLITRNMFPLLYFGSLYLASRYLKLSQGMDKLLTIIGVVLLTIFLIRFLTRILGYWMEKGIMQKEKDPEKLRTVKSLRPIINIFVWIIGSIFLLSNLGFDISAVVAGLGISGIAIALAAQAVLGDLFSYFSILLDRPFELGDFIIVGDYMGVVEHVGIKTTRIRSLGGEQLIFSNTDLTGSRVRNYKRMQERRIVFRLGVTYDTPLAKLEPINTIIRSAVESQELTRFDRSHFASYGDSALEFEIVYYVLTGDYNLYMDIQQAINLAIARDFQAQGIEFAFPTQTLYIKNETDQTEKKQSKVQ